MWRCRHTVRDFRRVGQVKFLVQVEVYEPDKVDVELHEGEHHSEVHIRRAPGGELVGDHPRDHLPLHAALEVEPLDGEEHFAEGARLDQVQLELSEQSLARVDHGHGHVGDLRQGGEEGDGAESIVQVPQSVR